MAKYYHFSLWPAILHYFLIMLFGLVLGAWQNDMSLRKWRNGGLAFDRTRGVPIILVCSVALVLWYMKLLAYGEMLPTLAACLLGYGVSSSYSARQPETDKPRETD